MIFDPIISYSDRTNRNSIFHSIYSRVSDQFNICSLVTDKKKGECKRTQCFNHLDERERAVAINYILQQRKKRTNQQGDVYTSYKMPPNQQKYVPSYSSTNRSTCRSLIFISGICCLPLSCWLFFFFTCFFFLAWLFLISILVSVDQLFPAIERTLVTCMVKESHAILLFFCARIVRLILERMQKGNKISLSNTEQKGSRAEQLESHRHRVYKERNIMEWQ